MKAKMYWSKYLQDPIPVSLGLSGFLFTNIPASFLSSPCSLFTGKKYCRNTVCFENIPPWKQQWESPLSIIYILSIFCSQVNKCLLDFHMQTLPKIPKSYGFIPLITPTGFWLSFKVRTATPDFSSVFAIYICPQTSL